MGKSCGNCQLKNFCTPPLVCCEPFKTNEIEALKSQLADYQPHPFNPEDKGTWPEVGVKALFQSQYGDLHSGLISASGKIFLDSHGSVEFPIKINWWCKLPGKEGE